jgi:hypothetical protein
LLLVGREYAKTQIPDEAIRYPVDSQGMKTLGELFHEVLKVEVLGEQERRFIWKAIKERNRLIHRFWTEDQRWEILTPEGRGQLIEELEGARALLRTATGIVHQMLDRYLAAYGQSIQRYMDQAAAMWVGDIELPGEQELIH